MKVISLRNSRERI